MKKLLLLLSLLLSGLNADDYKLGRGYEWYNNDTLSLNISGHFDTYWHTSSETNNSVGLDQAGLILSGNITPKLSFLVEGGSDDIIDYDLTSGESQSTDIQFMRAYAVYRFYDALSLKAGLFLSPIGIWNRTYIPALRWSNFTPYVAKGFFPKIIAGVEASGYVFQDRSFSYSLFYHKEGEYDTNKNNVVADEFVGGEVRYHFGLRSKVAIPFGRYRSETSKEICLFTGMNILLPFNKNEFSAEMIYKDGEWTWDNGKTTTWKDYAWYLQYVQHLYEKHFAALRVGQSGRFDSMQNWDDKNVVLSYIYKPQTSLSIKAEYRHREISRTNSISSDESLLSFSVLF